MTRTCRRLLLPLIAVAITACGSDQTGPSTSDTVTGSYHGVSADGFPLPHTGASGVTLNSYAITTRGDLTYDLSFSKTRADGTPADISDSGTYSYDASTGAISFTGQIPGVLHGTISDGESTITLSSADVGYTVVLKR
jgi:hypothetical protein